MMRPDNLKEGYGQGRIFYLDCTRALAIISITFNHALSRSFSVHVGTLEEYLQIPFSWSMLKALLYVFSRIGVPLFLMISGALLLKRDYEKPDVTKRFIRHNWIGLLITTEIWLTIMFWYLQLEGGSTLKSQGIVSAFMSWIGTLLFVNQTTMSSMWYMPMILCLYLMFPVMSIALKRIGDKYIAILCAFVAFSAMIIPNINTALAGIGAEELINFKPSHTDVFSYFFVYVLIGYWINKGTLQNVKNWIIVTGFLASFLATTGFQYWTYSVPIDYCVRYADMGVVLSAACLFEIIRRGASFLQGMRTQIALLSKYAFGIYFVHICIMAGINNLIDHFITLKYFTRFCLLECVGFFGALLIVWLTAKNKVLRKYLYMIRG